MHLFELVALRDHMEVTGDLSNDTVKDILDSHIELSMEGRSRQSINLYSTIEQWQHEEPDTTNYRDII